MSSILEFLKRLLTSLFGSSKSTKPSPTTATPLPSAPEAASNQTEPMKKVRNKIGFHTGPGGNPTGIGDWMRRIDAAGIPFFLKSVDSYGPLFEAAKIAKKSGVAHTLVYRISTYGQGQTYDYDVPPYKDPKYVNDPEGGAELHWRKTLAKIPPEFDKELVWIEPINEVDKNLCSWLGRFALHTANLAKRDGYKVSLFAWSSGEPEAEGWLKPEMLDYLRLCAKRPEQAAVAIHEYSFLANNINDGRPFKIGRFQLLFDICDRHNIARPTIHITEWGWALNEVPSPQKAIEHVTDIGQLYAPYPTIKGAAIWYLGPGFSGVANQTQRLIKPMADFTLRHTFKVRASDDPAPVHLPDDWPGYDPDGLVIGDPPDIPNPIPPPIPIEPPINPDPVISPPDPDPIDSPKPTPQPNGIYIADVTIPDDMEVEAGATFTKTWRVKNTGNVAWNERMLLLHVGGVVMSGMVKRPLSPTPPNTEAEISLQMTAPTTPGIHFTDYRFQDENGTLFGETIYARIVVVKPAEENPAVSEAIYIADVTIPDDTVMAAGEKFVKTWRVRNTGTRSWNNKFSFDFVKGVAMTNVTRHPLPPLAPNEEGELSLSLTAPTKRGTHFGDWQMRDDQGQLFGEFIFLRIVVK